MYDGSVQLYSYLGIVFVMFSIFLLIFILKCCIVNRRTTKVTRRKPLRNSYQNIENVAPTAAAPPHHSSLTEFQVAQTLGIDDIVVVPEPEEASPVVVPPYPVEPRHPTPQAAPPGLGFTTHNPPYPTHTPHPIPGVAPYPPAGPGPYPPVSGAAPYPPTGPPVGGTAPYPDYGTHPPSYSEAISQPPVQPLPVKEGYSKQAPYNPNY